jgi:glutathione S-transferase
VSRALRPGTTDRVIELYQAEWCPFSHMVRQRLTELGLPFIARQVEPSPPQRKAMKAAVDSVIIPVLVLDDGTVLNGDAREILAELDRRFPETEHTAEHHERRLEAREFE